MLLIIGGPIVGNRKKSFHRVVFVLLLKEGRFFKRPSNLLNIFYNFNRQSHQNEYFQVARLNCQAFPQLLYSS